MYCASNSLFTGIRFRVQATVCLSLLLLQGCTFAPGLQTGVLPVVTDTAAVTNGLNVQVEQITASNTLPSAVLPLSADVLSLFKTGSSPIYLLEKGDVLDINLWAHPEITPPAGGGNVLSGYVIDQNGNISFPLIGSIRAQNRSLPDFERELSQRLAGYLKRPDVQVKVLQYNGRQFFIDGDVKQPGQYAISDKVTSLYSAITAAGGMLPTADINHIELHRDGRSYPLALQNIQKQGYLPQQIWLQQGDSIHVYAKENRKVFVMGEVNNPVPLMIPEDGLSLARVLGESKGLNQNTASSTKIYVVRDEQKNNITRLYHLDMSSIANIALAERFKMQPDDIVYIDATGLVRWSRVINLLLPSATAVRTGQVIGTGN